jgi:hypothetical protein
MMVTNMSFLVYTLGAVKLIMHQGQTTTKLTGCKLTPLRRLLSPRLAKGDFSLSSVTPFRLAVPLWNEQRVDTCVWFFTWEIYWKEILYFI